MTPMPQELKRPLDIQHRALIGHSRTRIRRLFGSSRRRIDAQRTLSAGAHIFACLSRGGLTKVLECRMI
jgi:hypothetical protein